MHYSAGPASLTMFASAAQLRHAKIFWSGAAVLLDAAGGLFAVYLVVMVGLLLIGFAGRLWVRRRTP